MKITCLIVDDMDLARARLRRVLLRDPEIEIVGECSNGTEAIAAIRSTSPDLVFLDVQMPEVDGFDVVATIRPDLMPTVVFVTAFDEFALRAFEVNALDYLLKPFDDERLVTTLTRVKRAIKQKTVSAVDSRLVQLLGTLPQRDRYIKRIPVKAAQRTVLVITEDIDWIGAAGNYLELHVGKQIHMVRERMHNLEQRLDPEQFVRVHRSTIVNIDRIEELHPMFNGDHVILLNNGTKINLSRTYYDSLLARIA